MVTRRISWAIMAMVAGFVWPAMAQDAAPRGEPDDPMARPTEFGVRFTPGIARALAQAYVDDVAIPRYGLDASKVEQVKEAVARRLMTMAHKLDDQNYHEVLELMVRRMFEADVESNVEGGPPGIKPKGGQAFGDAITPALPLLRELFNGVGRDVRPLLEAKQQLTLGVDLMALNTGLDVFGKTMERWSKGEVRPNENPLGDNEDTKSDEQGRSQVYNNALKAAQREMGKGEWSDWKKYVENAKKFYTLDESQSGTADSILRECLDRAEAITKDAQWQARALRNRLWLNMLWQLQIGPSHPLRHALESGLAKMLDPIRTMGEDLKRRIDDIPTQAQREAADKRVLGVLADRGYEEKPLTSRDRTPASQQSQPAETSSDVDNNVSADTPSPRVDTQGE